MKINQEDFEILRKIQKRPNFSQRKLAEDLGFSLGKLNYCLKALQDKGLLKINNFQKQKNKINYIRYILTPKGIAAKNKINLRFHEKKIKRVWWIEIRIEKRQCGQ